MAVVSIIALALLALGVGILVTPPSCDGARACGLDQLLLGAPLAAVGILVGFVVALVAFIQAFVEWDWITFGVLGLVDLASMFVLADEFWHGHQPNPTLGPVALVAALGAPPLAVLLSSLLAKQRLPRVVSIGVLAVATFVLGLAAAPPWAGWAGS
jgi:hypothetical protein